MNKAFILAIPKKINTKLFTLPNRFISFISIRIIVELSGSFEHRELDFNKFEMQ